MILDSQAADLSLEFATSALYEFVDDATLAAVGGGNMVANV